MDRKRARSPSARIAGPSHLSPSPSHTSPKRRRLDHPAVNNRICSKDHSDEFYEQYESPPRDTCTHRQLSVSGSDDNFEDECRDDYKDEREDDGDNNFEDIGYPPLDESSYLLTRENLHEHDRSNNTNVGDSVVEGDMSTKTASTTKSAENLRLTSYDIYANREEELELPKPLKVLINKIKDTQFPDGHIRSPHAKSVVAQSMQVWNSGETSAIREIARHLLALAEEDLGIALADDRDFRAGCVPKPGCCEDDSILAQVMASIKAPKNPRPDITFGYRQEVAAGKKLFSSEKSRLLQTEEIEAYTKVCPGVWFPFLTAEWKSNVNGGNMYDASLQSARTGAAIPDTLHKFFLTCGLNTEDITEADTAHFTIAVDGAWVCLKVHWRRQIDRKLTWENHIFGRYFLSEYDHMLDFRRALHNIFRHAVGPRFKMIEKALSSFLPANGTPAATPRRSKSNRQLKTPSKTPSTPARPPSTTKPTSAKDKASNARYASQRSPPTGERSKRFRGADDESEDELQEGY